MRQAKGPQAMEYAAEMFDQVQLLFDRTGFNDHQLHCVLRFDAKLDAALLRRAVIASIAAHPILGTRYVDDARKPHWVSLDPARFADAFLLAHTEPEFEHAVTSRIDEGTGPQVGVCLRDSERPALALTMNHMSCDAAGFKAYLYALCETYTEMLADPDFRPAVNAGDRGVGRVLRRFSAGARVRSLVSQSKDNNSAGEHRFPLSEGQAVAPFILTRRLGRDRLPAITDYCRAQGATLNDAVLTAYYRCLFASLELPPGAELRIPVMVDMRRYLGRGAGGDAPANLSSTVITQLQRRPQESFAGSLARVKAVMDEKKIADIGLNGFIKLDLIYRLLPSRAANHLLMSSLRNPLICMTNVGILDSSRLAFGAVRPRDAFLCGSIKYKPHFQIAMSTYAGELTLSCNLYGSGVDKVRVASFLEEVEGELITAVSAG